MVDEKKLIRRYRAIAFGYGFRCEADDIAQEAFLGGLERPKWKQTPHQRVIDAIRKLYGRDVGRGCPNPLLNRLGDEDEEKILISTQKPSETHGIDGVDFRKAVSSLGIGEERCIFLLRFAWGFNEKEIGNCLGVSESRISQRLKAIQKRVLEAMADKESGEVSGVSEKGDAGEAPGSELQGSRESKMEEMVREKKRYGSQISIYKNQGVETEESRQMELNSETCFPEWFA